MKNSSLKYSQKNGFDTAENELSNIWQTLADIITGKLVTSKKYQRKMHSRTETCNWRTQDLAKVMEYARVLSGCFASCVAISGWVLGEN